MNECISICVISNEIKSLYGFLFMCIHDSFKSEILPVSGF
jgi:hypothetical protein